MIYTAFWIVKTKTPLIHLSITGFWDCSENDKDVVTQHMILNSKFCIDRGGYLAKDGTSIIHYKTFVSKESHDEWKVLRDELPRLDEDLTFKRITEKEFEDLSDKYVVNRGYKLSTSDWQEYLKNGVTHRDSHLARWAEAYK